MPNLCTVCGEKLGNLKSESRKVFDLEIDGKMVTFYRHTKECVNQPRCVGGCKSTNISTCKRCENCCFGSNPSTQCGHTEKSYCSECYKIVNPTDATFRQIFTACDKHEVKKCDSCNARIVSVFNKCNVCHGSALNRQPQAVIPKSFGAQSTMQDAFANAKPMRRRK